MASKARQKPKGKSKKKPEKKGLLAGLLSLFGPKKKTPTKSFRKNSQTKTRRGKSAGRARPARSAAPASEPQWDQNQQQWDQGQQSLAGPFGDFDPTAGGGYEAGYQDAVANYDQPDALGTEQGYGDAPASRYAQEPGPLFPAGVDDSLDSLFASFETTGAPEPPSVPGPQPAAPSAPGLTRELDQAFASIGTLDDQAGWLAQPPGFPAEPAFGDLPAFQPAGGMADFNLAPGDSSFDLGSSLASFGDPLTPPPPPPVPAPPGGSAMRSAPPPAPAPPGGRPGKEQRPEGLVSLGKMLVDQNALKRILDKAEKRGGGQSTTRIISATRGQDIDQLLARICQVNGATGAFLVGRDGLVISSMLPGEFDKEMVGAIASSMYSNLDVQCKKMQVGSLNWGMLETSAGLLMLVGMDAGVLGVLGQGLDTLDLTAVWMSITDNAERVQ